MLQVSKEFMMSPNKLHLECSLDKELYYHGETISVNVHIQVRHVLVGILHLFMLLAQLAIIALVQTVNYSKDSSMMHASMLVTYLPDVYRCWYGPLLFKE